MAAPGMPKFGCPKCASADPRDDQLCVECMRAKIAWLNELSMNGGRLDQPMAPAQVQNGGPRHQNGGVQFFQPAQPSPAPAANQQAAPGIGKKIAGRFLTPFWIFVFAYIVFFFSSGLGMISSHIATPQTVQPRYDSSNQSSGGGASFQPMPDSRGRGSFRGGR